MMFVLLVPAVLLLAARTTLVNSVASPLTYEDKDPLTGEPVQCDRCPPGAYLRASCSSTRETQCAQCPEGSFTELWNYIDKCLRCGVCGHNQVVKKACTADSDCQCECKQGYYYREEFGMCVRHSECPSAQGVFTKGTPEKNTVCHVCSSNTFSNFSSASHNCTAHKNCIDAGLQMVLSGSTWHDSVCANCTELKDGADYLREIIPAFFVHQKMNIKRLRRIVHKLPSEDGKKKGRTSELNFSELHAQISAWAASATAKHIRQFPDMLIKSAANGSGERLQTKLNHIDAHLIEQCGLGSVAEGVESSA
ncbi:tumor necrosis factor receptor superfamily member 6B [Odontesthes bonariensis]|uniref:tumor necrosis factor receptor superfamily member 6B n=1 Tax=Odontesthes bonariensis TaxID=219752 RepID=UPI003F58F8A8